MTLKYLTIVFARIYLYWFTYASIITQWSHHFCFKSFYLKKYTNHHELILIFKECISHWFPCHLFLCMLFKIYCRILWRILTIKIEDPIVTVKCRTAIKVLFLYRNLCLSVNFDSISCSFTSISFLTYLLQINLYVYEID